MVIIVFLFVVAWIAIGIVKRIAGGAGEEGGRDAFIRFLEREREIEIRELSRELTPLSVGMPLKRGEDAFWRIGGVRLLESRKVRTGTAFGGPMMSIPVCRGIRFRAGYLLHSPSTEDALVELDEGEMVVTNRAIYYIGQRLAKTVRFSDIVRTDVSRYDDPQFPLLVSTAKSRGKIMFWGMPHPVVLIAALSRLTHLVDHLTLPDPNVADDVADVP